MKTKTIIAIISIVAIAAIAGFFILDSDTEIPDDISGRYYPTNTIYGGTYVPTPSNQELHECVSDPSDSSYITGSGLVTFNIDVPTSTESFRLVVRAKTDGVSDAYIGYADASQSLNEPITLTSSFGTHSIVFENILWDMENLIYRFNDYGSSTIQISEFYIEIENGTYPYIGDMNGDGVLNTVDGLYLLNHINGNAGYEILHDSGDINCDGVIDQDDVDYLGNHLTGNPDYAILYDGCKP